MCDFAQNVGDRYILMKIKNMNINSLRLGLLSQVSFAPFSKSHLSHSLLCALSSVALIEAATAATPAPNPATIKNVQTNGDQNASIIEHAYSTKDPSDFAKKVFFSGPKPFVSRVNHTYLNPTTIGAEFANNAESSTEATFYNMGRVGSAGQSFTVNPQGVLRGSGTVVGNVTNKGLVSPGNNATTLFVNEPSLPIGTTKNVDGDYTQTSTGQTLLYFTTTKGDKLAVTGTVDFTNGTIKLTPLPGYYSPSTPPTYTAITWGTVTGAATLTGTNPNVIVTTATPGTSYLDLNVTSSQTASGLAFTFTGIDKNLTSGSTASMDDLASATGSINANNGSTMQSIAGASGSVNKKTIATQMAVGGTATYQAAAYSKTAMKGALVGDANAVLAVKGTDSTSQLEHYGDASAFYGTISAEKVHVVMNTETPGNVTATAQSILSGEFIAEDITLTDATGAGGNSIGDIEATGNFSATNSHIKAEINATTIGQIIVHGKTTLSNITADVVMDEATYAVGTKAYPFILTNGTLSGNINTLTWLGQSGLNFDVSLDATSVPKVISLISTVTPSDITLNADQVNTIAYAGSNYIDSAYTSRIKRRIITNVSEEASTLTSGYDYITLIGGTIANTSGSQTITKPINISGTATISSANGTTTTLTGAFAGSSGSLAFGGTGTTIVSADNTSFTRAVAINNSTVKLTAGKNLGSGNLSLSTAILNFDGTTTLNNPVAVIGTSSITAASGATGTIAQTLSGSGTLTLGGSGILQLNATNSLTGAVTVNATTVKLASGKNLGTGILSLTGAGATVQLGTSSSDNVTLQNAINLSDSTNSASLITPGTTTFSGAISGSGTLNISGGGTANITTLTSGTIGAGNTSIINLGSGASGATLKLTSGTVNLANGVTYANAIAAQSGTSIVNTPAGAMTTLSGALTSLSGSTLKFTGGTVSVTGANAGLVGTTMIDTGATASLGDSATFGSGTLTLNAGTLKFAGTTTLNNAIALATGTTSAINIASAKIGTLSQAITGTSSTTLNVSGSGKLAITTTNPNFLGAMNISSAVDLSAGKDFGSGALTLNNSTLTFLSGTPTTTTIANAMTTISGTTTSLVNNVGTVNIGALTGSGTLNVSSGNAANTTYFTASNTNFTGPVNVSSKINIGSGSNFGTTVNSGAITLNTGAAITLGGATLNNPISMSAPTTITVMPAQAAILSGSITGTSNLAVTSSATSGVYGSLRLQGSSTGYTKTITANNINLYVNAATGADVAAGQNSILGGTGTIGAATLSSNAIIAPGDNAVGTLSATSLTTTASTTDTQHLYVMINNLGRASKVKVNGPATLTENLVVDILMEPGTYSTGLINYPIIDTSSLIGYAKTLTCTTQSGLAWDMGLSEDGKSILLKSTINSPFTINSAQTSPGTTSATILSTNVIPAIAASVYNTNTTASELAGIANGIPVNLSTGITVSNSVGSTQTIATTLRAMGTLTITNTGANDKTIIQNTFTGDTGTTLTITGAGQTTFSSDNKDSLKSNITVTSSTVNIDSGANLGTGTLTLNASTANFVGTSTISNATTILGASILNTSGTTTFAQSFSGSGSSNTLKFTGAGTSIIAAANPSLESAVTIENSNVRVLDRANLGTGTLRLTGASTTVYLGTTNSDTVTLANAIKLASGSTTTLIVSGTGTLSGAITDSGTMNVNGTGITTLGAFSTGTLTINSSGTTTLSTLNSGTVNINNTGTTNITTLISGAVNATGTGNTNITTFTAGTMDVSAGTATINTFTSGTVGVNNAIVNLGSGAAGATLNLTSGTVNLANDVTYTNAIALLGDSTSTINSTGSSTISGALSNTAESPLKFTGGTTNVTGSNAGLLGAVIIDTDAIVSLGTSADLGSGDLKINGSTLTFAGTTALNNALIIDTGATSTITALTGVTGTLSKAMSGAGTLNISGAGTTKITQTNTFSGAVNVTSSKVDLSAGKDLGSSALTLNNATLTFLDGTPTTTTLANTTTTISGTTTRLVNNVGTVNIGALAGSGTLNLSGTGTTYFTASNTNFTGPVNISSKINIADGYTLGSGLMTFKSDANLVLGNVTLGNTISVEAPTTIKVNTGATATFSGALSRTGSMSVSGVSDSTGTLALQGYSPSYSGSITANNIGLFLNSTVGSAITASTNSILSGTGTIGALTLDDNAVIHPGDGTTNSIGTMNVASLTTANTSGRVSAKHFYVQINALGQASQIKVAGGATFVGGNLTVDVLMAPGDYPVGVINYPIIVADSVSGNVSNVTWTNQTGLTMDAGRSADGKSILLRSTITGTTLTVAGNTAPGAYSASIASDHAIVPVAATTYTTSTPASTIANLTPNTPVNLDNTSITNTGEGSKTLSAAITAVGTTTITNTNTSDKTTFTNPLTSALGTTLNITGAGETTFAADNSSTLKGNVAVNNSTVNVESNLGSGAVSLANSATLVVKNGARLSNSVTLVSGTSVNLQPSTTPIVVSGSLSGAGSVNVTGGGTAIFNTSNTSLSGAVTVDSTTAQVANSANLGSGSLILAKSGENSPAVVMGNVTLSNPISVGAAATFTSNANTASGYKSVLKGVITGNNNLTFTGTGLTEVGGTDATYSSPAYTGTLNAQSGHLKINSNMAAANVNVGADGTLSGKGTIGNLIHTGKIKPGNSIGTLPVTGNYDAVDGALYVVEINSEKQCSKIAVTGNANLAGTYNVHVLMNAGEYLAGTNDYAILTTGGTLTLDKLDLKYKSQSGLTMTVGKWDNTGASLHEKALVLKYTASAPFTIESNQIESDLNVNTGSDPFTNITIGANDSVSETGLSVVPVADQVELSSLVFQNNPGRQDIASSATADAFRFKGFSTGTTAASGGKGTMETLLTAISKNGPVAYEKNETRLWVSPFVNRSRANRTTSDDGNQGWSGGSLVGLEQRDQKNTWSLGLLSGLMGSRSHVIGNSNTFSKTNSFLMGAFNTYKYSKNWGHEALISRTVTFIDAQRNDLDKQDKKTPYFALSAYKTTTDVGNAQINYLFDIIKKKVTCRLNTGVTYAGSQSGQITERNVSELNKLSTAASTSKSSELYTGFGIRRIWEIDKITIRTTFVYEYGYEFMKKGSGVKTSYQSLTQSGATTILTTPTGPKQNKHYLQLNSSYLDRNSGLKFIMSYSGALYKNVQNHTGMVKVEYRF